MTPGRIDFDTLDAALAALDAAEAQLAGFNGELAKVGLEGGSAVDLVRHHRNNEAATNGAWKMVAEAREGQVAALVEKLHAAENMLDTASAGLVRLVPDDLSAAATKHDARIEAAAISRVGEPARALMARLETQRDEIAREAVEAERATLGDPCRTCHCPRGYHVGDSHAAYLVDGSECYCTQWLAEEPDHD